MDTQEKQRTAPPAEQQSVGPVRRHREEKPARPVKRKRPAQEGVSREHSPKKAGPQEKPRKKPKNPTPAEADDLSAKKRAYGNSKPRKKTAAKAVSEYVSGSVRKSRAKTRARREAQERTKRATHPTPAVIYTEPRTFNRRRMLIQLLSMTAIVAAFVLGLSVFFRVGTITVNGADVYDAWTVREASGIKEGDSLLTFSRPRAAALIKANLPYVKDVRFGIKLPDTVNIIVEEEDVVYAIKDTTGVWWLVSSKGRIVKQAERNSSGDFTQILGFTLENPTPGTMAVATENTPSGTDENGVLLPIATSNAQRLTTALQIVKYLEDNDIVGAAASLDLTRIEDIILWYGTRYQVNLGDSSNLEYKVACMNDVIMQMSEYQSGILDISFTIWPDQVGYTPFS